jgi:excinuclease ABC subunit A
MSCHSIDQRVGTRTSRSTVGSLTEIYDYLRILFARIGKNDFTGVRAGGYQEHVTDVCETT